MTDLDILKDAVTKLQLAKMQAETQKAELEMEATRWTVETAKAQAESARQQAEAAKFGLKRSIRPSSLLAPLVVYYDDIGSRWAVSYGVIGEQVIEMLPDHITETGVTAYGETPEEAMHNFDILWKGNNDD